MNRHTNRVDAVPCSGHTPYSSLRLRERPVDYIYLAAILSCVIAVAAACTWRTASVKSLTSTMQFVLLLLLLLVLLSPLYPVPSVLKVPLTQSLYVPGRIVEADKMLVDVGTGYYVQKDQQKTAEFLGRKVSAAGEFAYKRRQCS